MKSLFLISTIIISTGCATLTGDQMISITANFSDNSRGTCYWINGRGNWTSSVPGTVWTRRSMKDLRYNCMTDDGRSGLGYLKAKDDWSTASWGNLLFGAVGLGVSLSADPDSCGRYNPDCEDNKLQAGLGLSTVGLIGSIIDSANSTNHKYDRYVIVNVPYKQKK
ncbi:MAG: hypothetical protein GDA55_06095 [Cellvibrionales bacterium]|nr:hypothetical protein [Cellvibrionales bacterium]